MDEKKVIGILTNLLKKHTLSDEEQEALRTAIGTLAWTKLSEGYINNLTKARDRELIGLFSRKLPFPLPPKEPAKTAIRI